MDTLTGSVSTLKIPPPSLPSTRELHHFKSPTTAFLYHQPLSSSTKHTTPTTRTNSFSSKNLNFRLHPSPTRPSSPLSNAPPSTTTKTHWRPAVGYAAALVDKAICENTLESVRRDVRRLSRLLNNEQIQGVLREPLMGEKEKGEIVKEVVKMKKVDRSLRGLVKLLIERNKVGIVGEVLDEFGRIYDELNGFRVVVG